MRVPQPRPTPEADESALLDPQHLLAFLLTTRSSPSLALGRWRPVGCMQLPVAHEETQWHFGFCHCERMCWLRCEWKQRREGSRLLPAALPGTAAGCAGKPGKSSFPFVAPRAPPAWRSWCSVLQSRFTLPDRQEGSDQIRPAALPGIPVWWLLSSRGGSC